MGIPGSHTASRAADSSIRTPGQAMGSRPFARRFAPRRLTLRKTRRPSTRTLTFTLPYHPPYPWEQVLGFLGGRAIAGIESVSKGCYARTALMPGWDGYDCAGWLRVWHQPDQKALKTSLSAALLPALPQVKARLRRLFDLHCDPDQVTGALARMDALRPGLHCHGIRLPGCFTPFETAARAILGQQITVKAASTLAARLVAALGTPVKTGQAGLTHAFPAPQDLLALGEGARDRLGALGIIAARTQCILDLAREMLAGGIRLQPGADAPAQIASLQGIRGIGPWTANYIAMRTLGYPDAFLETDAGVRQALPGTSAREMLLLAEGWRPFRSYAVMNLWNSL